MSGITEFVVGILENRNLINLITVTQCLLGKTVLTKLLIKCYSWQIILFYLVQYFSS